MITVSTYTSDGRPFDPSADRIDLDANPHIEAFLKDWITKHPKKDGEVA